MKNSHNTALTERSHKRSEFRNRSSNRAIESAIAEVLAEIESDRLSRQQAAADECSRRAREFSGATDTDRATVGGQPERESLGQAVVRESFRIGMIAVGTLIGFTVSEALGIGLLLLVAKWS